MTALDRPAAEATDHAEIVSLVHAWAHHADRREPRPQAELFVPDGVVLVFPGDPDTHEPVQTIQGHDALADSFLVLNQYDVTSHVTAQSAIRLDGDRATGETYCVAYHVFTQDGERTLLTMSIRYLDTFARTADGWRFAERRLVMDWIDQRPSRAA